MTTKQQDTDLNKTPISPQIPHLVSEASSERYHTKDGATGDHNLNKPLGDATYQISKL